MSSNLMDLIFPINPQKPDGPALPIFPPGFFDPKKYSFAYIIMMVMTQVGMVGVEYKLFELAKLQPDADKVREDMFELMQLITEMENDGKGGVSTEEVQKFVALIKKIFGPDGDLAKLQAELKKAGISDDTVVQMVNSFKDEINKAFNDSGDESGGSYTKIADVVQKILDGDFDNPNSPAFGQLAGDLSKFAATFYYSANTSEKPSGWQGANWFNSEYTSAQSSQDGLQGLSSQFTAEVQQDSANLNSFQQTGQQILQTDHQLEEAIVQGQKTQ